MLLIGVPDPPQRVTLEVVGTDRLRVKYTEPESASQAASMITKYRGNEEIFLLPLFLLNQQL